MKADSRGERNGYNECIGDSVVLLHDSVRFSILRLTFEIGGEQKIMTALPLLDEGRQPRRKEWI